jgi:hypothetical protein
LDKWKGCLWKLQLETGTVKFERDLRRYNKVTECHVTSNVTRPPQCDEVEMCAATEGEEKLDLGHCGRTAASAVGCHIAQDRQAGRQADRRNCKYRTVN